MAMYKEVENMNNEGILIILSGPSGSGKGTVIKKLCEMNKNIRVSVSCTTREPRPKEIDGISYYFKTEEEFRRLVNEDMFFEYAEVFGHASYGTLKTEIEQTKKGNDVLLEIDVQGAMMAKKRAKDALMIFIAPPSMEELRRRLTRRQTEKKAVIERRIMTAYDEIAMMDQYDYIVLNDVVEHAARKIRYIIEAEKTKLFGKQFARKLQAELKEE